MDATFEVILSIKKIAHIKKPLCYHSGLQQESFLQGELDAFYLREVKSNNLFKAAFEDFHAFVDDVHLDGQSR